TSSPHRDSALASLIPPRETNSGRSLTLSSASASTSWPGFSAVRPPDPTSTSPAITAAAARARDANRPRSAKRVSRRRLPTASEPLHTRPHGARGRYVIDLTEGGRPSSHYDKLLTQARGFADASLLPETARYPGGPFRLGLLRRRRQVGPRSDRRRVSIRDRRHDPLGDPGAGEPDPLMQQGRFAVRPVAVGQAPPQDPRRRARLVESLPHGRAEPAREHALLDRHQQVVLGRQL